MLFLWPLWGHEVWIIPDPRGVTELRIVTLTKVFDPRGVAENEDAIALSRSYENRIAFAGAMRVTKVLGSSRATRHTTRVPKFNSTMGQSSMATGTAST